MRTLEITVLSGENLRINGRSVKKSAFVTVVPRGGGGGSKTEADREGGSYPQWNHKMALPFPPQCNSLMLEARSGSSSVGTTTVPVSDFIGGVVPEGYLHFLSYRLLDRRGRRSGILNLSIRVRATIIPN